MFINHLAQVVFPAFPCFSPGSSTKEIIKFVAKQMSDLFDGLNNLDNQQDIDSPTFSYCPVLCCPVNEIFSSYYLSFRRVVIGFASVLFNLIKKS